MGPIIEELPDDYVPTSASTSARQEARDDQFLSGVASGQQPSQGSAGGLRRGFFNRGPSKPDSLPAAATESPATSSLSPRIAPPATERHDELSGAKASPVPGGPTSNSNEEDDTQGLAKIVGELRTRLHSVAKSAAAAQRQAATAAAATDPQRVAGLLEPLRTQASSWPTPHAKSSWSKAQADISVALAEMRAVSNDARRLRSGEERRLLAELRRAVEDAVDRVKKIAEAAAPPDTSEKDHARQVAAGFRELPFTAKLRAIADDRVALALLGSSFLAGTVFTLGFLLELYASWGCGLRCTGR
mmetsp:Transcript_76957/g.152392  ORF Transcript_76957/g.152392 Transcript_76957/m.152392 type:complete len:302 (+) Transcript_76957:71-976(+)